MANLIRLKQIEGSSQLEAAISASYNSNLITIERLY
jgi:hypothetical protein